MGQIQKYLGQMSSLRAYLVSDYIVDQYRPNMGQYMFVYWLLSTLAQYCDVPLVSVLLLQQ